jgi:hypothetical protein
MFLMSSFLITVVLTIVLVSLAIIGLSIGLILTGKSRIRRGGCGMVPGKKRDDSCDEQSSCGVCGRGEERKGRKTDEEEQE